MFEQSSQHSRQAKRKRRSSTSSDSNDENKPWNEEKKRKEGDEDVIFINEDAPPNSSGDTENERLPLSELSVFECKNGNENQDLPILELISEQERLSISDTNSDPRSILSDKGSIQPLTEDEDESDFESVAEFYEDDDIHDRSDSVHSELDKPSTSKEYVECSDDYGQLTPASLTTTPSSGKKCKLGQKRQPLPQLRWANSEELWELMLMKDKILLKTRRYELFSQHPSLQPRMRAVLLDWIIEVCEVYKLHRETYYLAMDYLDRYLTAKKCIEKRQLQLIGITCLLIASKVEEIYPPKLAEFAYVTDGACTEEDILRMELNILKTLGWELSPFTVNNWLGIYLQLCYKDKARHTLGFVYPQFAGDLFKRISQLLDLSTLDVRCLKFSYRIIAASCLFLVCSKSLALRVSGFEEDDIRYCVEWMRPFWDVLQERFPEQRKTTSLPPGPNKGSVYNDEHNLLFHNVSLDLLEAGQSRSSSSPEKAQPNLNLLTPPSSSKKLFKTSSYT